MYMKEGEPRLEKTFKFHDFDQAMAFTNLIAHEAATEDHHPAILTEWGKVTVTWWTHVIKGLHQNDFVMAAKTDKLYGGIQSSKKQLSIEYQKRFKFNHSEKNFFQYCRNYFSRKGFFNLLLELLFPYLYDILNVSIKKLEFFLIHT